MQAVLALASLVFGLEQLHRVVEVLQSVIVLTKLHEAEASIVQIEAIFEAKFLDEESEVLVGLAELGKLVVGLACVAVVLLELELLVSCVHRCCSAFGLISSCLQLSFFFQLDGDGEVHESLHEVAEHEEGLASVVEDLGVHWQQLHSRRQ